MFTAFLDANALVPVALADAVLRAAEAGLFAPKWSSRVFAEAKEAIRRIHPALAPSRIESRFRAMDLSFPDACVCGWEPLVERIDLPDPDDRHVVAAAWLGKADAIVTADSGDFPADALEPCGLHAVHPDGFLLDLFDLAPDLASRHDPWRLARPEHWQGAPTAPRAAPDDDGPLRHRRDRRGGPVGAQRVGRAIQPINLPGPRPGRRREAGSTRQGRRPAP